MLTSFKIENSNNSNILHVIRLQSGKLPTTKTHVRKLRSDWSSFSSHGTYEVMTLILRSQACICRWHDRCINTVDL